MKEVQRGERSEHTGLQEEHQRHVGFGVFLNPSRCKEREGDDECCQENEEQPQTVDAEKIFRANGWNPIVALHELNRG